MKRILQLLVLSLILLASCTKDKNLPTASFDLTLSQPQAPATVTLTNTSTNALTYEWQTSDGKTSTETNPQFTFNQGGTYEIKLTAFNTDGSNSVSKSVVIENPPVPVKMRIHSLDFTTWDPGAWDESGAPDVYFKIWSGNTLVFDNKEDVVENIYTNCYWYFEPVIEVQASSQLKVELYDLDENDSDVIETLEYDLAGFTAYPTGLMSWSGPTRVEMEVSWVY